MEKKRVAGRFVREETVGDEGDGGTAAVKKVLAGAPRPKSCRSYTRKRIAEALPEIMEKFVSEAKKGSIQHVKLLIKLGGLDGKDVPVPEKRRGKGFAGRLLDELKKGTGK